MRPIFPMLFLPLPLQAWTHSIFADPARAKAYPQGATVVWMLRADLEAGENRLAVTGLPADTDATVMSCNGAGDFARLFTLEQRTTRTAA